MFVELGLQGTHKLQFNLSANIPLLENYARYNFHIDTAELKRPFSPALYLHKSETYGPTCKCITLCKQSYKRHET